MKETIYYRWVVIDNQETCYTCVVKMLDGYFSDEQSVREHYSGDYCFKECLYSVRCLDFSATPKWLAEKTNEGIKQ